jgi:hypothetical protein
MCELRRIWGVEVIFVGIKKQQRVEKKRKKFVCFDFYTTFALANKKGV